MIVAFRVDSSIEIGTGHVIRCLSLAGELKRQGVVCVFITRNHSGHISESIKEHGFDCWLLTDEPETNNKGSSGLRHASWLGVSLEQDACETAKALTNIQPDWLIVDHYSISAEWHSKMRPIVNRIMVIDDMADRQYDCDLLLDQNLGRKKSDYLGLVPKGCKLLIGPKYALLRPEFSKLRKSSLKRRKALNIRQVLIAMGGIAQSQTRLPEWKQPNGGRQKGRLRRKLFVF